MAGCQTGTIPGASGRKRAADLSFVTPALSPLAIRATMARISTIV